MRIISIKYFAPWLTARTGNFWRLAPGADVRGRRFPWAGVL